jgi:histidinol-phosphate aminotransferase
VSDLLREQGWTSVPDSQANFVWLRLGERTTEFAAACESAGVVVRPFAGEGARVTIGEPEANDVFLDVAKGFVAG